MWENGPGPASVDSSVVGSIMWRNAAAAARRPLQSQSKRALPRYVQHSSWHRRAGWQPVRPLSVASSLTHIDGSGNAAMVDVSAKQDSRRTARAAASVILGPDAFAALKEGANAKGNVFATARLAGIMAAKRTSDLIPLCHPVPLSHVSVDLLERPQTYTLDIEASASCTAATGVEMEAMAAASVAALTVYDMCKGVSKGITISEVKLLEKTGGRSGTWLPVGHT